MKHNLINQLKDIGIINPKNLIWVVVGDAKTQFRRLKELGFGEPILLN